MGGKWKATENRGEEVGWSYINPCFCWTSESPFVTKVSDVSSETSDGVSTGWAAQVWHCEQALAWWTSGLFFFLFPIVSHHGFISLFFSTSPLSSFLLCSSETSAGSRGSPLQSHTFIDMQSPQVDTTPLPRWSEQSTGVVLASLLTSLFTQPEPLWLGRTVTLAFSSSQPHLHTDAGPHLIFKAALAALRGLSVQVHQLFKAVLVAQGRRTATDWFTKSWEYSQALPLSFRCKGALNWTLSHHNLFSPAECKGQVLFPHYSSLSWVGTFWMFWLD